MRRDGRSRGFGFVTYADEEPRATAPGRRHVVLDKTSSASKHATRALAEVTSSTDSVSFGPYGARRRRFRHVARPFAAWLGLAAQMDSDAGSHRAAPQNDAPSSMFSCLLVSYSR